MQHAASNAPDFLDAGLRRALRRSGLPPMGRGLAEQVLKSPVTWVGLALLVAEAVCAVLMYLQVVPDQHVPGGTMVGLGTDAIEMSARYAAITVIPLVLLFMLSDRFRPLHLWIWLITFGWGCFGATFLSMQANSWAAAHMAVQGDGDPAAAARTAVFVAPFVEESTKATILFWIAMLIRYRFVSRLSGIALAGLSASGFAFIENILYYGRAFRAASRTIGAEPEDFVQQLFIRRGVMTFFAHPLFTCMTGIGLAIALRTRSKTVRVVAPLIGFLAAALLHMLFNGMASSGMPEQMLLIPLAFIAWPMVIGVVVHAVRHGLAQQRLIRARLTDYQRMGWLRESDPRVISSAFTRLRMLWQAMWSGCLVPTWRTQRQLIELAYLRDSMVLGLVDHAGWIREKQLLLSVHEMRERALQEPLAKTSYPWQKKSGDVPQWSAPYPAPPYATPAGPAFAAAGPVGSFPPGSQVRTTSVNPAWGPPGS
ncbi:hypothetical protein GCM10027418_21070 [Mariniluteicoccus endophyticus]